MSFEHRALQLQQNKPIVFAAFAKELFYFRMHITKFILEQGAVPINPFMSFEYFLLDTVNRDTIRQANNQLVKKSQELWVFGDIADGVLAEIMQAKKQGKPIRYFAIRKAKEISEIPKQHAVLQKNVKQHKHLL